MLRCLVTHLQLAIERYREIRFFHRGLKLLETLLLNCPRQALSANFIYVPSTGPPIAGLPKVHIKIAIDNNIFIS